ncbi:MAG: PAS domain-containing protein [Verrucomicrobiota bacterium]
MADLRPSGEEPGSGSRDSANHASNVFSMPGALVSKPKPAESTPHHQAPARSDRPASSRFSSPASLDWESVINQLPFGMIVLGPDQRLLHENTLCRALTGYAVEDLGGIEDWLAALCPDLDHRQKVIESWRDHIWRNQLTRTFTLKGADQRLREIEFRPTLQEDGDLTLILEDVTERCRAEETQRHNKLKFRAMFSHASDGAILVDRTGRIIDANPAFLETVGSSLRQIRLTTLGGLLHPQDADALAKAEAEWRQQPENGSTETLSREVWLRTRSNEIRSPLIYCPIGESRANPSMGIYLFKADHSTAEKETLAKLRSVAQKTQALLNVIPDLILLVNQDDTVADFTLPAEPWPGLRPEEAWRGKPVDVAWCSLGNLIRGAKPKLRGTGAPVSARLKGDENSKLEYSIHLAACGDGQILAVIRAELEPEIEIAQPEPASRPEMPSDTPLDKTHHRFRNQLQLVTSLFNLEPQGVAAKDAFLKWQIRLRCIAQTFAGLSPSGLAVAPTLRLIADEVCSLAQPGRGQRIIEIEGDEQLLIDEKNATPFALLAGEVMRLIMVQPQPGPGPDLSFGVRSDAQGQLQLKVQPGKNRKFIFTDEETEIEILEILSSQMEGRLQPASSGSSQAWELTIPPASSGS